VPSRDRERAQATAEELGAGALGVELDVRDANSVSAAIDSAYEVLDGMDVLVNNAGIGMRTVNPRFMTDPQPFWEVPPAGFRDVLETKATGTFLVAREVVSRMLSAGGGRLVTISMSEETMTRRGFIPYGPSGAAVEALARVMAADLTDTPVTANILLPGGATDTGMIPDAMRERLRANLLEPAIMGRPIVWLASPKAAGVHDERIVARDFDDWLAARLPQAPPES
jgi:NAD(P)-dependent dehydrogenase (short-subunit alcohol dehydrogenase family)